MQNLVAAVRALLEARQDEMVTKFEWEALAAAAATADLAEAEGARTYEAFSLAAR